VKHASEIFLALFFWELTVCTVLGTVVGAETAQGLPNAQLFYSFLRGAAKQFGTWIWGNASVYNRWNHKTCAMVNQTTGSAKCRCSAVGTSLALFRRLMYQQLLYGVKIFGFETLGGCGDPSIDSPISPIAKIQDSGRQFAEDNDLGVHIVTFAVLADTMTGYAPPRNLYGATTAYRQWGNIPFSSGAHWMNNILDLFYPGYQDASYHHNETGFVTPTPFTDGVDVFHNDVSLDILARYPVIHLTTPIISSVAETKLKLSNYVSAGGKLFVTVETLASLPGLLGTTVSSDCQDIRADSTVTVGTTTITERYPLRACKVFGKGLSSIAQGHQLAHGLVDLAYSTGSSYNGTLVVLATSGMASKRQHGPLTAAEVEATIRTFPNPWPMADHVRALLTTAMHDAAPFAAGDHDAALSVVVNRVRAREYIVAVANTDLKQQNFKLSSNVGTIDSIEEIILRDAALASTAFDNDPGYCPTGFDHVPRGVSSASTIAGVDQRVFKVLLEAETAVLLPTLRPATAPDHIALPMPDAADLRDAISMRPTFRQHFDAVVVDYQYVERRTTQQLKIEGRWTFMRGVSILVDFTGGLNLYPDLRLCNNSIEYEQSIARMRSVLSKMSTKVNASTSTLDRTFSAVAIVSEHRSPENYYGSQQCQYDTRAALASLAKAFPTIEFHLQTIKTQNGHNATVELAAMGSLMNMKIAAHVGDAVVHESLTPWLPPPQLVGSLFVAAPSYDDDNAQSTIWHEPAHYATSAPLNTLSASDKNSFTSVLKLRSRGTWVIVDASMPWASLEGLNAAEDAEFAEVSEVESMLRE
jgi:hypothetical protein